MELEEKKIFYILSPHINYYHSYRGDFRDESGFGMDIRFMEEILNQLDMIEDDGLCGGKVPISWDYADIFWSIQLQKEYQQDILDRVVERCKLGKDEVIIGSWGNTAQSILDAEEFQEDQKWFLHNSMGIGVNQLFPGRVAPYVRAQEMMFTQGLIEQYIKVGIKGVGLYYSVYPFDSTRPFLNPRLDWNQRFNPIKFKSVVSDASIIMIPVYSFGDIIDYYSIKKWFELIREKQKSNEISGHALVYLNFDMDEDTWIGIKLPKLLQWMPNSRGIREHAEAVDMYDYIEFSTLLDVIPKLKTYGETMLREDVADGLWNGYYNWAQKYDNTKFWTLGQRARWLKCISDSISDIGLSDQTNSKINKYLREGNDLSNTYIKNKILFASTTNFGLSMPFLHPHRYKTAMNYVVKAHQTAKCATDLAINEKFIEPSKTKEIKDYQIIILPIVNRGITKAEKKPIKSPIFVRTKLPNIISEKLRNKEKELLIEEKKGREIIYSVYKNEEDQEYSLESFFSESCFTPERYNQSNLKTIDKRLVRYKKEGKVKATRELIENEYIKISINEKGIIKSVNYNDKEFGCYNFLETAVKFGKKKGKRFNSSYNDVKVIRDGSDNFSASLRIKSVFEIFEGQLVQSYKTITLYSKIPHIFINAEVNFPEIKGESISVDGTSSVQELYDIKWKEIMPCELRPKILAKDTPLRIWKHNFLGHITYFDLDMEEVDPKNSDIDCLVANISDGWMALSNGEKGILIGFNSLKAANFAFSPIKLRGKGFGDTKKKLQQIRINPFGTYYGKMLHYWTDGTGHSQKIIPKVTTTYRSTAPTFSGKTISFELLISPYIGDKPPDSLISFANHYSLPPLVLISNREQLLLVENYSEYEVLLKEIINKLNLEEIMDLSYLEWVRLVNKNFKPSLGKKKSRTENIGIGTMLKMFIDGLKGR